MGTTRREFCTQACQAMSLAALGSVLSACGGSPASPTSGVPALPVVSAALSGGVVTVTIDAGSPLATVGNAALVQAGGANLLVARTGQNTFTALTAICTHQQCTITGFDNQLYVCPCHGSEYNTSGGVVRGPAPASLRQFSTQFSGNVLTINS